jgi:DNA-binding transcriptional MerR regulator
LQHNGESLFQARDFARLSGVTVRTLHHYDRLGLLKPSRYTQAGYRLYSERDLVRLQQIVTLKYIGLPLKQIEELLNRKSFDLARALRVQREALAQKREQLELALKAIAKAETAMARTGEPDWETFKKIIEVINMQNNMEWTKQYYSDEAQEEILKRKATVPPEVIEQAQREWPDLIKQVEEAIAAGEKPEGAQAQALADRWLTLIQGFTGGNKEIQAGLNKMYADRANWPATFPRLFSEEVQEFMWQAIALRQQR